MRSHFGEYVLPPHTLLIFEAQTVTKAAKRGKNATYVIALFNDKKTEIV